MTTGTRTSAGEASTAVGDGFAGFRVVGQTYSLTYIEDGNEAVVQLPHAPGQQLRVSKAEFAKQFRKRQRCQEMG